MKKNKAISTLLLLFLTVLTIGCDLSLQEKFEFDPETSPVYTFGDTTPLEWIQTNPGEEFSYLSKAIELTGSEDLFSKDLDNKTFFLMKDDAFRAADRGKKWIWKWEMMTLEFNMPNVPQDASELDNLSPEQLATLKNVLAYNVITKYVDQGPEVLFIKDKDYQFETVFQGPINNVMSLRRNRTFGIEFNRDASLPTTRRGGNVSRHNYIFGNGSCVAHLLTNYTRIAAFE